VTVARSTSVLIGTTWPSTGATIANNATSTSSELDAFGNNSSEGWFEPYLAFTSTVTAGTLDVTIQRAPTTGNEVTSQVQVIASYAPINGSQSIDLQQQPASRFATWSVKNNATGASATNVVLITEITAES
jgi:hypothetical protein